MKKLPIKVHNTYMEYDGWGDGVRFLHAVIEETDGTLKKIKWCDGQHWMCRLNCGWARYSDSLLETENLYELVSLEAAVEEIYT